MPRSTSEWVESFTIFGKYLENGASSVTSEIHGAVIGGPNPSEVSEVDDKRLRELDWTASSCGNHYQAWT